jgi:hypothetical protein
MNLRVFSGAPSQDVAFSPDGRPIAAATRRIPRVWNLQTFSKAHNLQDIQDFSGKPRFRLTASMWLQRVQITRLASGTSRRDKRSLSSQVIQVRSQMLYPLDRVHSRLAERAYINVREFSGDVLLRFRLRRDIPRHPQPVQQDR